jgi:hypothetical protein
MSKLSSLLGDFAKQHPLNKSSWKRFAGALAFSSFTSLCVIYLTHKNYWEVTIYRVQTVDFNILSNVLPSKLSTQLLTNDRKGIQATLDSNYGLFGMIVTDCKSDRIDCPQQKITYASKATVQTTSDGKQKLVPESGYPEIWAKKFAEVDKPAQLLSGDFLLLRDPIPNKQEWKFKDAHDTKSVPTGLQNSGKIIGRVYLLRGNPPLFTAEIQKWLQNPLKISRTALVYNAIVGSALLTGIIVWLFSELAYFSRKKADVIKLKAETQIRQAAEIKLVAEVQIRQAAERVLIANQIASEAKANAIKIQAAADIIQKSEFKPQHEKLDAQDRAEKAEAKAREAEAEAERLRRELEYLYNSIGEEQKELEQKYIELENKNEELEQKCLKIEDGKQEPEKFSGQVESDEPCLENNLSCINQDNHIKVILPTSRKARANVVNVQESRKHHRPKSWKSVKSMLEELDWVEYVRFDKNAFNAPRNEVKIATRGTQDGRHIFWIHLAESSNSNMAVSVETTGHTEEHAQEAASILRTKSSKIIK